MTRIIAGFAGSLTLAVPAKGTRPTSERVREAIFSALEARDLVRGARVLDLYAGSGALGLEAASRGAAHVTLVEKHSGASAICRRNAAQVESRAPKGVPLRITVVPTSVTAFLSQDQPPADLVFLDPPYDISDDELADALARVPLADDALVLVERATRAGEPRWPEDVTLDRSRKYGDTTLWWASR